MKLKLGDGVIYKPPTANRPNICYYIVGFKLSYGKTYAKLQKIGENTIINVVTPLPTRFIHVPNDIDSLLEIF